MLRTRGSFKRRLTVSKERAQVTVREIHGPYMQLLSNLQGEYGRDWLNALKRFLRKEEPWKRLQVLNCLRVPEYYFEARHHLKLDTSHEAYVPVAEMVGDFVERFADIVDWEAGLSLPTSHTLIRESFDTQIIAELGEDAEIGLGLFWEVLRNCYHPEEQIDFEGYMAYVRDGKGYLHSVTADWDPLRKGWVISAVTVPGSDVWMCGVRILSR